MKKITKMEALELMEPVMEAMCDQCIYPCEIDDEDELDRICSKCVVESKVKNLMCQLCEIKIPDKGMEEKFISFWKEYPRKENRKKAYEIWMRLRPSDMMFEVIMYALRRQKQSEQWQRGYAPHASTWLNGERWND